MFLAAIISFFCEDVGEASVLIAYLLIVGSLRASLSNLKPLLSPFDCILVATWLKKFLFSD